MTQPRYTLYRTDTGRLVVIDSQTGQCLDPQTDSVIERPTGVLREPWLPDVVPA